MANKKYEFVDGDTKVVHGRTLRRIRALATIGLSVSAGDIGGYIESEKNLDVSGDAWVSGDAQVYDTALVCGDAWVCGNAQVCGNAWVYDTAQVCGNAQVYNNAEVYNNAQVYGNAWVSGDAVVYGNAVVCGNAWVYDNAVVCGNAQVYNNAQVYGNARVYGNAVVCGNAQVDKRSSIFCATNVGTENGTLTVFKGKDGLIVTRGCFKGTTDEFLAKSEKVHDGDTHWEYRLLIEVAKNRITKGEKNNG